MPWHADMKPKHQLMGKTVAVVAGGVLDRRMLSAITKADAVVGVDRGALWLLRNKIPIHLAIGDFDSITFEEKRRIHNAANIYMEYESEKDMTDLELAVREVAKGAPKKVWLFAVLGKRFDHTLGAMQSLAYLSSHNIDGEIVDNFNKINIVRRGVIKFSRDAQYRYLSIIPLTRRAVVTATGVKYSITTQEMLRNSSLGISNEITGSVAVINVHQGAVFVVRSTDSARS